MPRDIMSSEPRHWMVFGQLVMPVQCCAEALPQYSDDIMSLGIRSSALLRVEETDAWKFEVQICGF